MFPTLTLTALVLAAPVPKDTPPPGPAPRFMALTAGDDGKVKVDAIRAEKRTVQKMVPVTKQVTVKVLVDGKEVEEVRTVTENVIREVEMTVLTNARVELSEVRDLTIYTAEGKEADRAMALKKLADGGVVVVSDDGKKVDPKYLKLLRDDVLVLVSPELARVKHLTGTLQSSPDGAAAPGNGPALVPQAVEIQLGPPGALPPPPLPPVPPVLPPPPKDAQADKKKD